MLCEHALHAFNKCPRVKLGPDDVVRAVTHGCYAPITNEGYRLMGLLGFDLGAQGFGIGNAAFAFHIDQDEVILARLKSPEGVLRVGCGIHLISREAKDLVAQRAKNLAPTDMEK